MPKKQLQTEWNAAVQPLQDTQKKFKNPPPGVHICTLETSRELKKSGRPFSETVLKNGHTVRIYAENDDPAVLNDERAAVIAKMIGEGAVSIDLGPDGEFRMND